MARFRGPCALALLVLLRSAPARAQPSLDLQYEAPAGCPDRAELVRRIEARAPRGWSAADDRSFHIRLERGSAEVRGRLEIERGGHVVSVREIRSATCEIAATSMAVFVAIALDPAESAPPAETPPPDTVAPPAPPPPPPPLPPPPALILPPAPAPAAPWYLATGLAAGAMVPSAWGGRVEATLTRSTLHLAPELRLSMGWSEFTAHPDRGGNATIRYTTARAEGCIRAVRAPLMASACAGFEVGRLRATTRDLPQVGSENDPWLAPSATLRPALFLRDWLSVEAEVGPLFPLTRGVFVVTDPERIVYRIPAIAAIAAVGFRVWAPLP